jgi:hypothetical protein
LTSRLLELDPLRFLVLDRNLTAGFKNPYNRGYKPPIWNIIPKNTYYSLIFIAVNNNPSRN